VFVELHRGQFRPDSGCGNLVRRVWSAVREVGSGADKIGTGLGANAIGGS
jgi:hypothetical protein